MRRGLAASFREDLDARIAALEEAISGKVDKTAARVSATVAVSGAADRGRVTVRELDAVVRNLFRDDPATLAEWERQPHRTGRAPLPRKAAHAAHAFGRMTFD